MTTEPFNLTKALAGHPVKLRTGEKAFVLADLRKYGKIDYPLVLVRVARMSTFHTTLSGQYEIKGEPYFNIVSMWTEPLTMPNSFWRSLDPVLTQIAKDGIEGWYAYTSAPLEIRARCNSARWFFATTGGRAVSLHAFNPAIFPTCQPEDSLITRPEGN